MDDRGPVRFPPPPVGEALAWTGERFVTSLSGQIRMEHHHRYLFAMAWCAGRDVLDVACGEGYGSALLASVAASVIGVDVAEDAVAFASRAYAAERVRFVRGPIEGLPLPEASVDVVVCFETIEHAADQGRALDELRRVLRPGGVIIISTPDREHYRAGREPNEFHTREYSREEFRAVLASRFAHVRVLGQRVGSGSWIVPEAGDGACGGGPPGPAASISPPAAFGPPQVVTTSDGASYRVGRGLDGAEYIVAVCSDGPVGGVGVSVLDDRGYSPAAQDEASRRLAAAAGEGRRARAELDRAQREWARAREAGVRAAAEAAGRMLGLESALGQAVGEADELRTRLGAASAALSSELSSERARAAAAEAGLARAREQAAAAQAAHEDALRGERARNARLEAEVARVTRSRSWRWTGPARAAAALIRGLFRRGRG